MSVKDLIDDVLAKDAANLGWVSSPPRTNAAG